MLIGWLKRYVMGPHTPELLEDFFSDLWAGAIVAMTLLPQVKFNLNIIFDLETYFIYFIFN
jgi:hypothetical protein